MKCERAGFYLIDKAPGRSSADEIARVKRALKLAKVGHAGTLDPFASGLLICMSGAATRLADLVSAGRKVYSGVFLLGTTTATDDVTGAVLEERDEIPSFESVRSAIETSFVGAVTQVPPDVSAIKINGARAYDLARRGESLDLPERTIQVYGFACEEIDRRRVGFRIECSKGTYIRSIARDLGARLGCGGCVETLRREASSPFDVGRAKPSEFVSGNDLIPWYEVVSGPVAEVSEAEYAALAGGDERAVYRVAAAHLGVESGWIRYSYSGDSGGGGLIRVGEGKPRRFLHVAGSGA